MTESTNRLKPSDLTCSTQTQFQQHWEARTVNPLVDCMHGKYFGNVRSRLEGGDEITLIRFQDLNWAKVREIATMRVVDITPEGEVHCILVHPIIDVTERLLAAPESNPIPVYVQRIYGGKFTVMGLEQEMGIMPEFPNQRDALEWIANQAPTVVLTEKPAE